MCVIHLQKTAKALEEGPPCVQIVCTYCIRRDNSSVTESLCLNRDERVTWPPTYWGWTSVTSVLNHSAHLMCNSRSKSSTSATREMGAIGRNKMLVSPITPQIAKSVSTASPNEKGDAHLDYILYLLLGQDISGGVARVDYGNTSNLGASSAGSRKCIAQVIHLK